MARRDGRRTKEMFVFLRVAIFLNRSRCNPLAPGRALYQPFSFSLPMKENSYPSRVPPVPQPELAVPSCGQEDSLVARGPRRCRERWSRGRGRRRGRRKGGSGRGRRRRRPQSRGRGRTQSRRQHPRAAAVVGDQDQELPAAQGRQRPVLSAPGGLSDVERRASGEEESGRRKRRHRLLRGRGSLRLLARRLDPSLFLSSDGQDREMLRLELSGLPVDPPEQDPPVGCRGDERRKVEKPSSFSFSSSVAVTLVAFAAAFGAAFAAAFAASPCCCFLHWPG